jgi:membrane protein implicated in regulation of membrane protease activity
MEVLPYFVTGAGVLAAIIIGIVVGGWFWVLTAVALVVGAVYVAGDRRLRRRESPEERQAADPRP